MIPEISVAQMVPTGPQTAVYRKSLVRLISVVRIDAAPRALVEVKKADALTLDRIGQLRKEVTAPVAPTTDVSDQTLFEDATDGSRKFYLPRYKLAEETVSGKTRYRIALETRGSAWALTVYLEKYPAPEIELAARTAAELAHEAHVVLRHRIWIGDSVAGEKEWVFPEREDTARGIRSTLPLETLEERDQIYRALTEGSYAANLVVRRSFRAALPLPLPEAEQAFTLSSGSVVLRPKEGFDLETGTAGDDGAGIRWTEDGKLVAEDGTRLALLGKVPFQELAFGTLRDTAHTKEVVPCSLGLDATAAVFVTANWNPPGSNGVYDPHPLGVWFDGSAWSVFHEDFGAMPENAAFNVLVPRKDDNVFVHQAGSEPSWSGWDPFGAPGPGFQGAPATVSRNPSVCNIYVRGGDNALWQLAWYEGQWHSWGKHEDGGVLASEPAVDSMGPDHEHVFVRGTDGEVWHKWWMDASGWSGWVPLGAPPGGFHGKPSTISRSAGVCNVYVWGADGALWQLPFYGGQWHPWARHADGGVLTSVPAPGSMGPDHEHVFVRGTDDQVWVKWWLAASGWSGWLPLGAPPGGFLGGPAVVSRNQTVCNLYVRGKDNALWQRPFYGGVWHAWLRHSDGGELIEDPAPGSMAAEHEHIFIRGTDQQVWKKWWPAGSSASNIIQNWTTFDHPLLNQKPEAICLVSHNWNPGGGTGVYNASHIGVWYTGSHWAVFNQDRKPMPPGASFNVRLGDAGADCFIHRASAENTHGHVTFIKNPRVDGKPDAILIVTPNYNPNGQGGVYNNHAIGVWHTGSQWAIFNQDIAPMPEGAAFNVEIAGPEAAFVHKATPSTIRNHYTIMETVGAAGVAGLDHVISAQTKNGGRAKIQVIECGELLSIRWVAYSDLPRFHERTVNLDLMKLRESFTFPPNLYSYIFRAVEDVANRRAGLIRHRVEWQGKQHSYFQDEASPRRFYYLPDSFKLARRQGVLRSPDLTVKITSPDGSLERTSARLDYAAEPVTDSERLNAAAPRLKALLPENAGEPELWLLEPSKSRLKLGLPKAETGAVTFVEQTDALVSMIGIRQSIGLPIREFQAILDGIFSSSSLLFQGQIEVELGEDAEAVPPVPFVARFNDLAGELFEYSVSRDGELWRVKLRNVIESPVRVHGLSVMLVAGSRKIPTQFTGLTLPADLSPSAELLFQLSPSPLPSTEQPAEAVFDFDQIEVLPDKDAIWASVLDSSVSPEYVRSLRVRTVAEVFSAPSGSLIPPVSLIVVELRSEGGRSVSVDLTPTQLSAPAQLRAPLKEYILGRADEGRFQYRVIAVRGGMRPANVAWKTGDSDLLITTQDFE